MLVWSRIGAIEGSNENWLATGGYDGLLRFWNGEANTLSKTLILYDGTRLATLKQKKKTYTLLLSRFSSEDKHVDYKIFLELGLLYTFKNLFCAKDWFSWF